MKTVRKRASVNHDAGRARRVTQYRASSLSLSQFAERHGLKPGQLHYWAYRSPEPPTNQASIPTFREVRLPAAAMTSRSWSTETRLPNGTTARLARAFVRVGGWPVVIVDGLKRPKEGRQMPSVKSLQQESDCNAKAPFIMDHLCQVVTLLVQVAGTCFGAPIASRIHPLYRFPSTTFRNRRARWRETLGPRAGIRQEADGARDGSLVPVQAPDGDGQPAVQRWGTPSAW